MNENEFLEVLDGTKIAMSWSIKEGSILASQDGQTYCPITAVAKFLLRQDFPMEQYLDAATKVGLCGDRPRDTRNGPYLAHQVVISSGPFRETPLRKRIIQTLNL